MFRLYLIALVLFSHISFGQLYLGTTQGGSVSQVYFSPAYSQQLVTGYSGGLVLTFLENEGLGIDVGLIFNQRGWALHYEDTSYSRLYNTLELPFLSHFTIGKGNIRGVFLIGANLGYLMSAQEMTETSEGDYQFTEQDNRLTFGLSTGGGVKYVQPNWFAVFSLRYANDLSNLYESNELTYSLSQNILIQASVSFKLKREN